MKTINEFTEEILDGTDWKLREPIDLKAKQEEPVIKVYLNIPGINAGEKGFSIYNMNKNNAEEKIVDGSIFYVSYSTFNEDSKFLIFLYRPDGKYEKDESTRIINNADCYYVENTEIIRSYLTSKGTLIISGQEVKLGLSTEFRGEFYSRRIKTTFDPFLKRYV
jgi:uncharacterized protein YneR